MKENQTNPQVIDFKSLRHPSERSRWQLLMASVTIILIYFLIIGLTKLFSWLGIWYAGTQEFSSLDVSSITPNYLYGSLTSLLAVNIPGFISNLLGFVGSWLFLFALILAGLVLWIRSQVLKQQFMNQAVEVNEKNFPDTWQIFEEVKKELGYKRPLNLYLIESDKLSAEVKRFYQKTVLVLHSELVQQMINQQKTTQLKWVLASLLGSIQARYYRLDYLNIASSFSFVNVLNNVELLKIFNIFTYPYQRATVYSGDQIGLAVSGNLSESLQAMNRILVGNDLSSQVNAYSIAQQATEPSSQFFSTLSRLYARSPRPVKRFANLLAFAQAKYPQQYEAYMGEKITSQTNTKLTQLQKDDRKVFFMKTGALALTLLLIFGITQLFNSEKKPEPVDLAESLNPKILEKYDMVYNGNADKFDGLIPATKDERIGLITSSGKEITPIKYDRIFYPSNGLVRVAADGKFGFINKRGKEVIPLEYDIAADFLEDKAEVEKDGKSFTINRKGKCIENCP